ncbi:MULTISPECIES: CPBP family intramembrane glutamic endopeptidase [Geobacillus]|uniref:CPBP family intramembrane glutamic endopeptidase n=1 Tax=Geobacillus TaxID=129337 RepID=UPI0006492A92|nr:MULTISPECIES: type II CAAX endopeptidase family protein [Geobacillus]AKM17616.1 hypothetical protein GARCT_00268 [Geobacillus sp. 12AMOR1]AKU26950.1 hypothetical protein IB49_11460 [Geobacillus sp. LC300]KZE97751.1 hypothetical protein AVP43_00279 [Geobacillus stearothermophilus]NNV00124.1 CPBP family intramembrane metalloprotease [Geobacillus sp. DSP4a]QNU23851.1 CPBP family intramembrane metalloprotease [Geobacillus zalihae]
MIHYQRKIDIKNFTIFFIIFLFVVLVCSFSFTRIAYSSVGLFSETRKMLVLKDEFTFVILLIILIVMLNIEKRGFYPRQRNLIFYSLVGACCAFFFIGSYIFKFITVYRTDIIIDALVLLQIIFMVLAIWELPICKPLEKSSFIGLLAIAMVDFFFTMAIVMYKEEISLTIEYLKNKTFYFVQPILVIGIIHFVILLISIKLFGKLNIRSLGLFNTLNFMNGVAIFLFVWVLIQFTQFVVVYLLTNRVVWVFTHHDIIPVEWLGNYFAYILGVGLPEELLIRGVMFTQLYALFLIKFPFKKKQSILMSLIISQVFYGMNHLPKLLEFEMGWDYLIRTFMLGIFFVLVYLRTGSIYVSILVHGLMDYHVPLFYSKEIIPYTEDIATLVQFYTLIALICWSCITKNSIVSKT